MRLAGWWEGDKRVPKLRPSKVVGCHFFSSYWKDAKSSLVGFQHYHGCPSIDPSRMALGE